MTNGKQYHYLLKRCYFCDIVVIWKWILELYYPIIIYNTNRDDDSDDKQELKEDNSNGNYVDAFELESMNPSEHSAEGVINPIFQANEIAVERE